MQLTFSFIATQICQINSLRVLSPKSVLLAVCVDVGTVCWCVKYLTRSLYHSLGSKKYVFLSRTCESVLITMTNNRNSSLICSKDTAAYAVNLALQFKEPVISDTYFALISAF